VVDNANRLLVELWDAGIKGKKAADAP
jgi:hypothetical protein